MFNISGFGEDLNSSDAEVTSSRLLEMIEAAYPTPLSAAELAKYDRDMFG